MQVTSINNNINSYSAYYTTNTKDKVKNENVSDSDNTTAGKTAQTSGSIISGNKANETKTNSRTVKEYTEYLYNNFSFLNRKTIMYGVPTTVVVSSAYIKKCANDPEKAKVLEENLAVMPDCVLSSKKMLGAFNIKVTFKVEMIDDEGHVSSIVGGTSDPDGKIAKENEEKRRVAKKEEEAKAAKRAEERRHSAERSEKRKAEREWLYKMSKKDTFYNNGDEFYNREGASIIEKNMAYEKNFAYMGETVSIGGKFNSCS